MPLGMSCVCLNVPRTNQALDLLFLNHSVLTCERFSSSCVSLIVTVSQIFCIIVSPIGRTVIVLYCHVINGCVEFLIAILMVVSK